MPEAGEAAPEPVSWWGYRPAPALVVAADIARAVVVVLAVLAGLWWLRHSVAHFWSVIGPIYRNTTHDSRADFTWYYVAFQTVWQHVDPVRNLYSVPFEDRWMQRMGFHYDGSDLYSYPPQFAMAFSPLAALSFARARQVWTALNIGCFAASALLAAWTACPKARWGRRLLLTGAFFWAAPATDNFYWGQSDTITLFCLAAGLFLLCRPRPGRAAAYGAGVALALAAVFKLTPIILLVYLPVRWAFRRETPAGLAAGRAAISAVATVVGSSVLVGVLVGWRTLATYVHTTIPAVQRSAWAHGAAPWNQSFRGLQMLRIHNLHTLTTNAHLFAALVFVLLVAAICLRPAIDHRLEAVAMATAVLLAAPSLENHHFVIAALPWVILGGYLIDALTATAWAWPAALLFAFASALIVSPGGAPHGHQIAVIGPWAHALIHWRGRRYATFDKTRHFWLIVIVFGLAVLLALPRPWRRDRSGVRAAAAG